MFCEIAVEAGMKPHEFEASYISDIWLQINAYASRWKKQWQLQEEANKWQWYMTRLVCHTVHLHSMAKKKITNAEKFMPSPWDKNKGKIKVARTPQEVWEDFQKMRAKNAG